MRLADNVLGRSLWHDILRTSTSTLEGYLAEAEIFDRLEEAGIWHVRSKQARTPPKCASKADGDRC